ncbi:MAG TPA: hypothetical protein VH370_14005 [Humisphaera sp.]|jgi:hypothetical protein|nr:hypothetical protein [Humisphaera sp.]
MHQIHDAIIHDGKLVLSDLPFADGQHVRVVVDAVPVLSASIHEVRLSLKGGVERFDDPFEPMIPLDVWEMNK